MKLLLIIAAFSLMACERKQSANAASSNANTPTEEKAKELPDALEALVTSIINAMPESRKEEIRSAEIPDMIDHLGEGMALRNGALNQTDSEVRRYLMRQGIVDREDLSGIVLVSVNRRIRGEPIELSKQIQSCRDFWKERDIIAPLDIKCPACGVEMDVVYVGEKFSKIHPERVYFWGHCTEHSYFYYHTDGWKLEDDVK